MQIYSIVQFSSNQILIFINHPEFIFELFFLLGQARTTFARVKIEIKHNFVTRILESNLGI